MYLELSTEIPGASRCLSRQEMFQSCMNNKIENSQADFSTLRTKTPEIQFCHLFLYCKLLTLRNSERKSPLHPHLLLTNQHKNADVSFIYLGSFYQKSRGCGLQNCHPFLGVVMILGTLQGCLLGSTLKINMMRVLCRSFAPMRIQFMFKLVGMSCLQSLP